MEKKPHNCRYRRKGLVLSMPKRVRAVRKSHYEESLSGYADRITYRRMDGYPCGKSR